MANVSLRHVYKIYDGGVTAVTDFNLEIADKEFIILVGPSGCGKSTTLRMIAGLEDISKGELYIGDTLANDVAPNQKYGASKLSAVDPKHYEALLKDAEVLDDAT